MKYFMRDRSSEERNTQEEFKEAAIETVAQLKETNKLTRENINLYIQKMIRILKD